MAGLLDIFSDPNAAPDPRALGLLGALGAYGQSMQRGPASRLPYAPASPFAPLGAAMSGFVSGYGTGADVRQKQAMAQGVEAENYGRWLKNMQDTQTFNMWAPYLGNNQLPMPGMGAAQQTANMTASMTPQAAQPPAGAPSPAGVATGAPSIPLTAPGPNAAATTPAGTVGASPSPSGYSMQSLYQLPPPLLQRMGVTVPPELVSAYAAGVQPGSAQWMTLVNNVAMKGAGINPTYGGDRPGVPLMQNTLGPNGEIITKAVPGSMETQAAAAYANAYNQGMGGLPAKEQESAFNAGLRVRSENEIEKRKAFYQTGVMPNDYGSPASMPVVSHTGDIATPNGTVVPSAPPASFIGTDALTKQNANTAEWEKNAMAVRSGLEGTESRLALLANALKSVQGQGLNEAKAKLAATLHGVGMDSVANTVMQAKDMQAVQTAMGAQTLDVLGQLKQINQGTGGRILNSEFTNLLDKQYGPDMSPQANFDLITQALGGVYQTKNMIDGYFNYGKPNGWRDAGAFQSAYLGKSPNSYDEAVKRAGKTIGSLKGMDTGPAAPQIKEGTTQSLNGQGYIFRNGRWETQ